MACAHRPCVVTAIGLLALLLSRSSIDAADQAISGKKLLLKSTPKLILISKDPSISIMGSDPVGGTDSFVSFDAGSGAVTFGLPKTLWSANSLGSIVKYKNADAPNGPSDVKIAKVRPGLLKVVAAGLPFAVPSGAATIAVVFSLDGGTNTYCLTFTGTGDGSKFLVKDALAGNCAPVPTATPAMTPTPTTPPNPCGNNVREGTEACDGTDAIACPNDCHANCTCAVCPSSGGDPTACTAGVVSSCSACCTASVSCGTECASALADECTTAPKNDACGAAVNAAGCASECCP